MALSLNPLEIQSDASVSYQYRPLKDRGSLRFCELLPGNPQDQINIKLLHRSLLDLPTCSAVSYAWGSTERRHEIFCEGKALAVTSNLLLFLARLRSPTECHVLWIDAICINQDDVDERSEQIKLMRDIYQNTKAVLIWVGDAIEYTQSALLVISKLATALPALSAVGIKEEGFRQFKYSRDVPAQVAWLADLAEANSWRGVCNLLSARTYFLRLWIVQEIILSSNAWVVCGTDRIRWEIVYKAAQVLWTIIQLGHGSFQQLDRPLSFLLASFWDSQASDPRDRVYGLLGMLPPGPQKDHLVVDYKKSIEQVFQDSMESIVIHEQSLDHWRQQCYDPHSRKSNTIPSWVLAYGYRVSLFAPRYLPVLLRALKTSRKMIVEEDVLTSYGHIIDTIEEVSECFTKNNTRSHLLGVFDDIVSLENPGGAADVFAAARQTLLIIDPSENGPSPHEEEFFCLLSSWLLSRSGISPGGMANRQTSETLAHLPNANEIPNKASLKSASFNENGEVLMWAFEQTKKGNGADYEAKLAFELYSTEIGVGRNIFRGKKGFRGVGPVGRNNPSENAPLPVQVGDSLALVCTVSTPMILRQREDGLYMVVGSAHVGNLLAIPVFKGGVLPEPDVLKFR
ncbi:hypothetical protein JHW43_007165 [Diplocarpon mali]|nr:hypothetical protein JHW43_007165 [Diplocarpon mali]